MLNSHDLINKVKGYNKFVNFDRLNKAFKFAVKAHSNQKRDSGDPYSVHPIEVANILTDLKLDSATIATGLLHDTIEDTYATYEIIKGEFAGYFMTFRGKIFYEIDTIDELNINSKQCQKYL